MENEANISIVKGDDGQLFASSSVALTVDFTSILESITSEEASSILSESDDRVEVMEWRDVSPHRKTLRIDNLLPDRELQESE